MRPPYNCGEKYPLALLLIMPKNARKLVAIMPANSESLGDSKPTSAIPRKAIMEMNKPVGPQLRTRGRIAPIVPAALVSQLPTSSVSE